MLKKIYYSSMLCIITLFLVVYGCRITDSNGTARPSPYISFVGDLKTPGHTYAVSVSYDRAFLADGVSGLRIIDISSPYFPNEIDKYESNGIVYDVKHRGDYAFLACGESGFKIIDIESPFGPEKMGTYPSVNAFGFDYAGDYVYLADFTAGVRILDISNIFSISEVSRFHVSGQNTYSTAVNWPYLYVSSRYGFSIVNIENVYSPQEIYFESLSYVYEIDIVADYAFIAFYGGLRIYDISDVRNPELRGELILPAPARSVKVRGDFAYITMGGGGLSIVRISNPYQPYEVDWYNPLRAEMNNLALSGRYLYIANGDKGLLIVDFWPGS